MLWLRTVSGDSGDVKMFVRVVAVLSTLDSHLLDAGEAEIRDMINRGKTLYECSTPYQCGHHQLV